MSDDIKAKVKKLADAQLQLENDIAAIIRKFEMETALKVTALTINRANIGYNTFVQIKSSVDLT